MTSRIGCAGLVAAWLFLGCTLEDEGVDAWSTRPLSLVVITLDTVRADALGIYGQPLPTTPRLDRMAREGVYFEHAMTAAPHTLAAHASLFTGLYPFAHGARANHGYALADSNVTLAERVAAVGYRTRAEISAPVLRAATRIAQGFDPSGPLGTRPTATERAAPAARLPGGGLRRSAENVTTRGIEFIEAAGAAPYLLWLHYFDAHLPYIDRPADRARFPDAPYLAQVAALDREVGRLVDTIERLGHRDRTLVVVTSDHGEGLGEHAEPTHSYFVYESTMRVPLIFWGADRLAQARRPATLARTIDVMPTLLDALALEPQPSIHGRSLWPLLDAQAPQDAAFDDVAGYGESLDLQRIFGTTPLRTLREGRWKYIHSARPELYDLSTDPDERVDLSASEPDRVAVFRDALEALLDPAASPRHRAAVDVSAATRAQLEALGYVAPTGDPSRIEDERARLQPTGPAPATLAADAERLSRAKGSIAEKRADRALALLEPIALAHPTSATVLSLQAEALAIAGRLDEALEVFDRAITRDQDPCSEVRLDLARALERAGREVERIDALEAGLAACPDVATYRNELAWALATTSSSELRDGERAIAITTPLLETGGTPDPNHLDTRAASYAAAGRWAEAFETQRRAIQGLEHAGADPKRLASYRRSAKRYAKEAGAQSTR